ncbi:MAG TPA: threonine--tRNA ligase [Longimicrobiales bacterium]|nr:threonine--tRNA ligase [Longimicrobiales bacterium]
MAGAKGKGSVTVTLPDGSALELPRGATAGDVAARIGPGLARAAVAAKVDGAVVDLNRPLEGDAAIEILTRKSPEALGVLRHSAAHVLATAVRRVRPGAGIGFGPAIEDGFYYDFDVEEPFTPEEVERIENEMRDVAATDEPFERQVVTKGEARELFADDPLKLERLEELGDDEVITVYRNGPFLDLCRGPHLAGTGDVKHVKLLSTAGAYWRGDERRQMLQRIYGTAWFSEEDLATYLHRQEEARRRDHRKLGRELDLFLFHPWAPGAPFWTDRGTTIYHALLGWMRDVLSRNGYQQVKTPLLYNKALWELSGHWGKYRENMFLVLDRESGEPDLGVKPMNCPSHHLLFAARHRSYRELPLRYATQDVLHRNEVSGALGGLTRVRQFQQDDAHVYLMESQVAEEVRRMVELIRYFYGTLGLQFTARFATRPEVRIGSDEMWDRAEGTLREALDALALPYQLKEGDGAFYGPKIDFDVEDALGRAWQLGTIQLDYAAPERFDLKFTGEDNAEHRPVVIHCAMFGSLERFIGILIEHFAGAFPVWLAPEQVRVLPISDEQREYAGTVTAELRERGVRVSLDDRSETLGYRIRDGETHKVPYMAVVGEREAEAGTVAVRRRGAGRKQEVLDRDAFAGRVAEEARARALE